MKKKIKRMSNEDIVANVSNLKFEPCEDCKVNAYLESPRAVSSGKSKQIQVRDKEILKFLYIEPHELKDRDPIDQKYSKSDESFI